MAALSLRRMRMALWCGAYRNEQRASTGSLFISTEYRPEAVRDHFPLLTFVNQNAMLFNQQIDLTKIIRHHDNPIC